MFIICPKCGAKYQIPAETTLEIGQKLKCSACDFIFTKGEEAPLTLTQEQPVSPTHEAFSEPIFRESDLSVSPKEALSSLPEAFQPVAPKSVSRPNLWVIIPFYLVLIVILCLAGWSFRELLKPTFSDVMPQMALQKPIKRPPPRVIPPQKPSPIKETVSQSQIPQPKPKAKMPPAPAPIQKPVVKPVVPPPPAPIQKPEVKIIVPPTPAPKPETTPLPKPAPIIETPKELTPGLQKGDIILDDTPSVPLFEVMPPPPAPATLSVGKVQFMTKPNESGVLQLLIDGMLYNTTNMPQSIPEMTAFVFNIDGNILTQKPVFVSETEIPPHGQIPFYTGITPAPEGITRVDVKLQGQK